jgi:hypothetical protein
VVDVRLFWNILKTDEHHFAAPIEIVMTDSTGANAVPATFENGAWRSIPELSATQTLPIGMEDGYWRDGAAVHVLTRHLTMFGLLAASTTLTIAPPVDVAGVVADDGLTVRWVPGMPDEQISNFSLYIDGQGVQSFGRQEYEAKLGQIAATDPRSFAMTETNLGHQESVSSTVLRVVPPVAGLTLAQASAALATRTFTVGKTVAVYAPNVPAGTIVGPTDVQVLPEGSAVDLQVGSTTTAQSPFAFRVASAPRLHSTRHTLFGRSLITQRARIDVTLDARPYHRIQRWHFYHVAPGSGIVRMKLTYPLKPGTYRLYWKATSDSTHSVKRSITPLVILPPGAKTHSAKPAQIVVVEGNRSTQSISTPGHSHIEKMSAEQAYIYATYQDVSVIVVNADISGLPLLRSLHRIFPQTTLVAISQRASTLKAATRIGAIAVPAGTRATKIATLIAPFLKR